jgi:hypothetical protein
MEALNTFLWWLAAALVCSFVIGTLIIGFLMWWCGDLEALQDPDDEEGEL